MSWTDSIIAGTDWSGRGAGEVMALLAAAASERQRAAHGDSGSDPVLPAPDAGVDLQGQAYWADISTTTIQPLVTNLVSWFVDHRGTPEGMTGADPQSLLVWSFGALRDAAGLAVTRYFSNSADPAVQIEDTSRENALYRRKRPREIASATATCDIHGNPAASGQCAYLIGDGSGIPQPYTGTALSGTVYRHNGTAWVRDQSATVDVLDNTLGPPDTISQDCPWLSSHLEPSLPGNMVAGDYLGAWVFEELRSILDLLRWTSAYAAQSEGTRIKTVTAGGYSTAAAAMAAAATAWAGASIGSTSDYHIEAVGSIGKFFNSSDGLFEWKAALTRTDAAWSVPADGSSLSGLGHKDAWYAYGTQTAVDGSDPDPFDANGDVVLEGQWHLWTSGGPSGDVTAGSGTWGDISLQPDFPAAPPDPGDAHVIAGTGYSLFTSLSLTAAQFVLLKWNVDGGFTCCSVVD